MPSTINRVPPGLLSLLDVKSMGVNPVQLGDQLLPVIELGNQYAAATGQLQTGTTPVAAAPGRVEPSSGYSYRAGPGELLVVSYVCARTTAVLGAGVSARFRVCMYDATLGANVWGGTVISGSATEAPQASTDRVLFVPPGFGVGVQVEQVAGGTPAFTLSGIVTILKI
jgi:hypothetical protein